MFGKLKESVLSNLEDTMNNKGEKDFKSKFSKYFRVLKENNELREFNETYNLLNELKFDEELMAKEFVEESITRLKELDPSCTEELKNLTEETVSIEGTLNHSIDELVFNNELSLIDKVTHKTNLIKNMIKVDPSEESLKESMESISLKLSDKISKLNEDQVKVLNLFAEKDEDKINSYYTNLIDETKMLVDQTITESEDIIIVKKLLSVNTKLTEMAKQGATLENVDNVMDLKKTFL